MHEHTPFALLAAATVSIIALTGSAHADAATDPAGAHSPTVTSTATQATPGQVTVTALTADEFADQRHDGSCMSYAGLTYCQKLQSHGVGSAADVDWTAYIGVPQDTVNATMNIGNGFAYTAVIHAQSPYVKVVWDSPNIPSLMTLNTDVWIDLDSGTTYSANCYATYESGGNMYDEEQLAIEPM